MAFDYPDALGSLVTSVLYSGHGNGCNDRLYYPFGEFWTGVGNCGWGITGTNTPSGNMHQTFAQLPDYDPEIDLYNTLNRHYNGNSGRWLSPDPLGEDAANPSDPQTWNMYAYARNNPTTLRDPSGLWGWDPSAGGNYTDEELSEMANDEDNEYHKWAQQALDYRQEFRDALYNLSESAGYLAGVQGALMAYGTENDSNGVFVGFSKNLGYGATTELQDSDSINVVFGSSMKGNFLTATVAHEGVHVDQAQTWMFFGEGSLFDLNHYAREGGAWEVEGQVAQALGMKNLRPHGAGQEYDVWNKGWSSGSIAAQRDAAVLRILSDLYHVKPSDTDTFSNEPHLGIP
jgi:RHS repeat-associated protein